MGKIISEFQPNRELFGNKIDEEKLEKFKLKDISVDKLMPCKHNPYEIREDEEMQELIESIKVNGILDPLKVREKEDGTYEVISGNRRLEAIKRIGQYVVPCMVGNLTDEEADIILVDSNLHRKELKISEQAKAYKLKLAAMKRQAGRPKNNSARIGRNLESRDELANQIGISKTKLQRLIKLNDLIPIFLEMVDDKNLSIDSGYNLSFLEENTQILLSQLLFAEPQLMPGKFTEQERKDIENIEDKNIDSLRKYFVSKLTKKVKAPKSEKIIKINVDELPELAVKQYEKLGKKKFTTQAKEYLTAFYSEE